MTRFPARFAWLAACWLLAVSVASAHEARPAYLEIRETAPGQFSVLWRTPALAGMRLPVVLKLPADLQNSREPNVQELAHATGISIGLVHRWNWGQHALRVVGAAIAVAGIFFMWKAFA